MNKLKLFALNLAIVLSFASYSLQGQSTKVSGIILDSLSNTAEVATVVQFFKMEDNSKPVAYTTTDNDGKFSHNLSEQGNYRLLLDNLGKKKKSVPFTVEGQPAIDLGTIVVEDEATMINEVTVTALRKLVEINADRITYKVSADAEAKTKSVLDILRKIPLVSVDGTGAITVNGNSSFLVYVDGRKNQLMTENPTEAFRSMPASMIKDIEVVTDPGARYDAEGVGGVLNITTNFAAAEVAPDGMVNGSISAGGSIRKVNGGAFISAKKDKWTMSANISAIRSRSGETELRTERTQQMKDGQMKTVSSGILNNVGSDIFGDLSASYEIDKYNLIALSAGIIDMRSNDKTDLLTTFDFPGTKYQYNENRKDIMRSDMINANLDYQHSSKKNPARTFVISYQFNGRPSKTTSDNIFSQTSNIPEEMNDRKDNVKSNSMTHNIQSDFIIPLAKKHRLNIGEKFSIRHNSSDINSTVKENGIFVPDNENNMVYDFYNNIGALYAEYNGTVKKFKLRAGVRYEHTWQKAMYDNAEIGSFNINYGNVVPNASIQYDINETQNIGITYSKSIKRPGITYLNPYINVTDPTTRIYGNPDLKAENGHQIGLTYNFFTSKWMGMVKLQHVIKDKGISAYSFYDDNHILNQTYGNLLNSNKTDINTYLSWNPAQKTRLSLNGTASYYTLEGKSLNLGNNGWLFDFMADIQQVLPANFVCNLSATYLPNRITLQSETNGIWNAMLSVSKSCLKEKLNISLTGITNLNKGKVNMKTVTTGKDFVYINEMMMPWKDVMINITYSFGGQDYINVKKSKKKRISEDQIDIEKD